MVIRLAFIGPIGSGKSTMAMAVAERYGAERLSFAGALKDELAGAFALGRDSESCFREEMDDPARKAFWRTALQWWGEARRIRYGDGYWAARVDDEIRDGSYVVDDCRYDNEAEMLLRHGFLLVRLAPGPDYDWTDPKHAHASERDWPNWKADLTLPWASVEQRLAWVGGRIDG